MDRINRFIDRHFGSDALTWFDRSYLTDWAVITAVWLVSAVISISPVYERDFSQLDPTISHPHRKNQVGSVTNHVVALFGPILIFAIVGALQRSLLLIHHGAIGVWAARGLARLVTVFLKNSIGRLRPDWLARCKWDKVLNECTGKASDLIDGRKSFPSGHSSTAFSGMFFLALWIAGQTGAWCFVIPRSPHRFLTSRILSFSLALIPILWATHVAVTRIQDYRHHKEDVVVGSTIGIASALICYHIYWPSPFKRTSFTPETHAQPRLLYQDPDSILAARHYELHDGEELNAV